MKVNKISNFTCSPNEYLISLETINKEIHLCRVIKISEDKFYKLICISKIDCVLEELHYSLTSMDSINIIKIKENRILISNLQGSLKAFISFIGQKGSVLFWPQPIPFIISQNEEGHTLGITTKGSKLFLFVEQIQILKIFELNNACFPYLLYINQSKTKICVFDIFSNNKIKEIIFEIL